jgi:hypothetical protein
MTMKPFLNWSAPLLQVSDIAPRVEILDGSAGVCTHIMPRKSR